MDKGNVKKLILCVFIGMSFLVWGFSLDIPDLSFRYDILQGSDEDEDSGELFPSSMRHSFVFGIKEKFDRSLWSNFRVGYVIKDFLQDQSGGDYNYVKISDNISWRVTDTLKLGFSFMGKRIFFSELDRYGFSKDYYLLGGKIGTDFKLFSNVVLNSWFRSNTYLNLYEKKSREELSLSGGITSKVDNFSLALRYRGTLRMPIGTNGETDRSFLNYGSFSLKWKK